MSRRPIPLEERRRTATERFWDRVSITDSCWLWTGAKTWGYGSAWDGDKTVRAHRYAYELCVGPIPDELTLDHLCKIKHCVNPDHLEPVTMGVNVLRNGGITAQEAQQTHCKNGHLFDEANTYRPPGRPRRICRACQRARTS